ncbi:MAG: rRNA adenine N(6)-methyltransferase family protein [Actinomycetota bacterium]|nr:rRNA adenine N(6)-methyltransferase family protein [Actinomycetota bacterium]
MAGSRRRWGWHELDPTWAERLVAEAGVGRGDLVLDIGAGHGALTAPLLASGARVIAIERHPRRLAHLRDRFGDDVRVVNADAADLRLPRRGFHVVANPPYGATAPILRRLLHPGSRLESAHLVLQLQAVHRWADGGDRRSRNGRPFSVVAGARLPRRAFRPPPKVDSGVLVVRRR